MATTAATITATITITIPTPLHPETPTTGNCAEAIWNDINTQHPDLKDIAGDFTIDGHTAHVEHEVDMPLNRDIFHYTEPLRDIARDYIATTYGNDIANHITACTLNI